MKKLLSLALATLMVGAMAVGCGGGNSGGSGSGSGELQDMNVTVASGPETVDPTKNSSVDGAIYITHLYEGLYRYTRDGSDVEFGVADSVDVSEDGKTLTFKLKANAKWSDGQAVKAEDFVYSFKRLVDPATAAPYGEDWGSFLLNGSDILAEKKGVDELGVKAIDDTTLEIQMQDPIDYYQWIFAFPVFSPVRKDVVEADPDKWWASEKCVSNGAFKVESFTMDSKMSCVPNENYWDAANIYKKRLNFIFQADSAAETAAFKAGEVVFADHILIEEIPALKEEGVFDLRPQLGTYYISFNTQEAPFDNPDVRKAFYLATDPVYISETTLQGTYLPAYAMVGEGFDDGKGGDFRKAGTVYKDNAKVEENKKAAQEALAKAGYPEGKGFPKVEYMYNTDNLHESVAQALQQQWKEVLGVEVTLSNQEWNTFLDTRRKNNFTLARNGWIADYKVAATMLTMFVSTSGNNDGKYNNPEFDKAIADAQAATDPAKKAELLHKAEDILMGEYGCAPLLVYSDDLLVSKDLQDWGYTPLGYKFFHNAKMASWE